MTKLDADEAEVLAAFNQGALKSVTTPAKLAQFKAAAQKRPPDA